MITNDKQRERLVELISQCNAKNLNMVQLLESEKLLLADYLLANGVIVPPLNIGDKVWIIDWGYEIAEYEVANMRYTKDLNGQRYSYDALMVGKNGADIGFFDSDIGKYVFLRKEEALSKLQASVSKLKAVARNDTALLRM